MRKTLSPEKLDSQALLAISSFHPETVKAVEDAVNHHKIVVVGMAQNPFVKKARKALEEQNLAFKYLEYGNYFSMWQTRLAIKLWSGWPTFPQVFIDSKLVGGFQELKKWLDSRAAKN
jgi:monothiol glutaredoxin